MSRNIRRLAAMLAAVLTLSATAAAQGEPTVITSLGSIGASGHYLITADIDASGFTASIASFSGTLTARAKADGTFPVISNLSVPIFTSVTDASVSNIMLKSVAIGSSADTVGAIACKALGYSRIYNCGILPNDATFPSGTHPTVTTTGKCAGGLVGSLRGDSRVVNCFSYADVQAANTASGLVGRNTFSSTAEVSGGKYTKLRTVVVNCMFYGNITGGTNQYGVYGDKKITNAAATGISSYNYYSNGTTFTTSSGNPTAYNCTFPADVRYLTQVEFHRSLLNSNRELCGWWVGSAVTPSTLTTAQVQAIPKDASLMAKWVLDPNIAPYPILKAFGKYPSIVNGNTGTPWVDRSTANPYEGRQLGTLKVNVKSGTHSTAAHQTVYVPITDMDTLHYDFGYRKAQLPYFNTVFGNPAGADWAAKYAGNYTDSVVTGWKVIGVKDLNGNVFHGKNAFVSDWQNGYNFADRDCTGKDIFDTSGRVFAQGGNYYVPKGVGEITIEAYWGKAIYVSSAGNSYDRVNITENSTGSHFAPAGTRPTTFNGYTVNVSNIKTIIGQVDAKKTVYDYALVLVGNVQESVGGSDVKNSSGDRRGYTLISVDLDFDEEPDYCLEWQLGTKTNRQVMNPVRFDFLPVVELGVASKRDGSTYFMSLGCFYSLGHYEVTETAFIRYGQFEFDYKTRDDGPVILNGGIFDQYTKGTLASGTGHHITYIIVGGHLVMPSFTPGAHVRNNANFATRHCAVNALGGDFTNFYLSGGYSESVSPYQDSPHCYIDGGRFGQVAAAYKEGIYGDVTWRINHAIIGEFYGGGMMSQATGNNYKIVKGNIDVVVDSSIVRKYCGGPKFGDMVTGKTVTTRATGTRFGYFYGAGNGGTNYIQYNNDDLTEAPRTLANWLALVNAKYTPNQYRSRDQGYHARYDYEQINISTGTQGGQVVDRVYYYSAQFATTTTGNVTSTLTGCTVDRNFYGAGFLGGVNGTVTSVLDDTRVYGSVYGAGYSASIPQVSIDDKDKTPPSANVYTGMIKPQSGGTVSTYYWDNDHGSTDSPATEASAATHDTAYYYTEIPLDNLGNVNGKVTLTIKGNSVIGTEGDSKTGNVFGGGDESAVSNESNAGNAKTEVIIEGNTHILGNVFAGGNNGVVSGSTTVTVKDTAAEP